MRNPKGMKKQKQTKEQRGQRAGREAREVARNREDKCVVHFDDNKSGIMCGFITSSRHTDDTRLSPDP